jgi:hypothetical protein
MKGVLITITKNRLRQPPTKNLSEPANVQFNDFVTGKGRGLNVLLQYGAGVLFHYTY